MAVAQQPAVQLQTSWRRGRRRDPKRLAIIEPQTCSGRGVESLKRSCHGALSQSGERVLPQDKDAVARTRFGERSKLHLDLLPPIELDLLRLRHGKRRN